MMNSSLNDRIVEESPPLRLPSGNDSFKKMPTPNIVPAL